MQSFSKTLETIVDSGAFRQAVLVVVVLNALVLGLQTSASLDVRFGRFLAAVEMLCLAFFVIELGLKLFVWRLRFFRSAWNVFDFIVIAVSFVPGASHISILRALRVLRVMRLLSAVPSLRRVVDGLGRALPGMASVIILLSIIFYVGSVMATNLFGADFPEWFGSIGASAYSLFQIMTLESWSMGIVRPVMELYPQAWAFFVPFIVSTSFAVMNLFVGLVVNAMQEGQMEEQAADGKKEATETSAFRSEVLRRLSEIEKALDK